MIFRLLFFVVLLFVSPASANPYDDMVQSLTAVYHFPFQTNGNSTATGYVVEADTTCTGSCSYGSSLTPNISQVTFGDSSGLSCNNCIILDNTTAVNPGPPFASVLWFSTTITTTAHIIYQRDLFATDVFFSINFDDSSQGGGIDCSGGRFSYVMGASTVGMLCSTAALNDGHPHMVAITCTDSLLCSLYVDGVFDNSKVMTWSGIIAGPAQDLKIGAIAYPSLYAIGSFTHFATQLSSGTPWRIPNAIEIAALYRCGMFNICNTSVISPTGQIFGLRDISQQPFFASNKIHHHTNISIPTVMTSYSVEHQNSLIRRDVQ